MEIKLKKNIPVVVDQHLRPSYIVLVAEAVHLQKFRGCRREPNLREEYSWTVVNSLPLPELSPWLPRPHRPLRKQVKSQICIRRNSKPLRKAQGIASRRAKIVSGIASRCI